MKGKVLTYLKKKISLICTIATVTVVSGATTAVVFAAIPDSSGTIHGCYTALTGTLRVIDNSTESCTIGETALNWSQNGAQTITNILTVPFGGADGQSILTIPNFGEVELSTCDATNGPSIVINNTTSHNITVDDDDVLPAGQDSSTIGLVYTADLGPLMLGYTDGSGNNYTAQVSTSIVLLPSDAPDECVFQAQATLAQN
jgi:hypothetical protein